MLSLSLSLSLRCDTMEKLRKRCETLDSEIKEKWKFKDFYQFTFNFAKNPGQKSLGTFQIISRSGDKSTFCMPTLKEHAVWLGTRF